MREIDYGNFKAFEYDDAMELFDDLTAAFTQAGCGSDLLDIAMAYERSGEETLVFSLIPLPSNFGARSFVDAQYKKGDRYERMFAEDGSIWSVPIDSSTQDSVVSEAVGLLAEAISEDMARYGYEARSAGNGRLRIYLQGSGSASNSLSYPADLDGEEVALSLRVTDTAPESFQVLVKGEGEGSADGVSFEMIALSAEGLDYCGYANVFEAERQGMDLIGFVTDNGIAHELVGMDAHCRDGMMPAIKFEEDWVAEALG